MLDSKVDSHNHASNLGRCFALINFILLGNYWGVVSTGN